MSCVFCKIIAGDIPSHRVYEDEKVVAFLDIGPVSRGHLLVVPRAHAETLDELDIDSAAAAGAALVRLSAAVKRAAGVTAWNVLQNNGERAGQLVPHVHFHLIPRYPDDGFAYTWNPRKLEPGDAESLKAAIAAALRGDER